MKVYFSERDNFLLKKYLKENKNIELISLSKNEKSIENFVTSLRRYKVDMVVQIAPQWEWGRYIEQISKEIMDNNIKLLSGEGSMFRWFGKDEYCGSDVGFYLSPWGGLGNSKIAYQLPTPTYKDLAITNEIRSSLKKWDSKNNNGKILIAGQLENDRARYFYKKIKSNEELIDKAIRIFGKKSIVFRKHPKDKKNYNFKIEFESSGKKLKEIIHRYYACISINSTASIEAMCSGVPVINDGLAPWSGASKIVQKLSNQISEFEYDEYLNPLASLVHLHFLPIFNYGDPLNRALEFYSQYDSKIFKFNCLKYEDNPESWVGNIY